MECWDGLRIFETIGAAFNAPIDTNVLLRLLAATIADRFKVDGCAIWLLSRDRRTLDDVASVGLSDKFLGKGPIDSARSVKDALDGEIVSIADCPNDPRIQYRAAFAEEGIVSLLALPLATRGQVIGVIRLYSKRSREFTDEEKSILGVAGSFCAYAVAHSMFQRIIHDINKGRQHTHLQFFCKFTGSYVVTYPVVIVGPGRSCAGNVGHKKLVKELRGGLSFKKHGARINACGGRFRRKSSKNTTISPQNVISPPYMKT